MPAPISMDASSLARYAANISSAAAKDQIVSIDRFGGFSRTNAPTEPKPGLRSLLTKLLSRPETANQGLSIEATERFNRLRMADEHFVPSDKRLANPNLSTFNFPSQAEAMYDNGFGFEHLIDSREIKDAVRKGKSMSESSVKEFREINDTQVAKLGGGVRGFFSKVLSKIPSSSQKQHIMTTDAFVQQYKATALRSGGGRISAAEYDDFAKTFFGDVYGGRKNMNTGATEYKPLTIGMVKTFVDALRNKTEESYQKQLMDLILFSPHADDVSSPLFVNAPADAESCATRTLDVRVREAINGFAKVLMKHPNVNMSEIRSLVLSAHDPQQMRDAFVDFCEANKCVDQTLQMKMMSSFRTALNGNAALRRAGTNGEAQKVLDSLVRRMAAESPMYSTADVLNIRMERIEKAAREATSFDIFMDVLRVIP